ncbi:dihydropteroate synthase [Pelistega sp. NLN82]|uniref:dihydropteroate synthase n=1 Tax=Pelistega ratti TaxID=2652177 RepID=A0A6L9Y5R0_9BURK|nr:dihydropteroate synthase [Pelistega ratti]NEN75810.1 dihydropteroate synthase [Pelistega ratti]
MCHLFQCGRFELGLERPFIMGIVNVTPDSFSDGMQHFTTEKAIAHGLQLIQEGADILDIGGESTRPGAEPVSIEEEINRILPVIRGLKNCGVPLSIDTFKPEVMQAALAEGADLINDIYALQQEGAIEVLKQYPKAGICIMHMYGEPKTMQLNPPDYNGNITLAVYQFLQERIAIMEEQGIASNRIMIDPGFGFGKTVEQNYELLANMHQLQALNKPILVGVSRKSMIGAVTGQPTENRVAGSIAAGLAGLDRGAIVLRVHDVWQTKSAIDVWNKIK